MREINTHSLLLCVLWVIMKIILKTALSRCCCCLEHKASCSCLEHCMLGSLTLDKLMAYRKKHEDSTPKICLILAFLGGGRDKWPTYPMRGL